jgi:N-acetylglucosamine malate deacetylase 1
VEHTGRERPPEQARRTLLAIGAHYDDCVFGIPGILVKATRRGWRVVILALIGDYSNFAPARDRSEALKEGCAAICADYGAEMRLLDFMGHRFGVTDEAQLAVARAVADVRPDTAFVLWPHDRHGDHGPAARLGEVALRHAGPLLEDWAYRPPRRLYAYDNGPRHTVGFEPDTYVDVTEEWPTAMDWLGRIMALAYGECAASAGPHPALALKEILAAYRGAACGVRYAEALRARGAYPQEIV